MFYRKQCKKYPVKVNCLSGFYGIYLYQQLGGWGKTISILSLGDLGSLRQAFGQMKPYIASTVKISVEVPQTFRNKSPHDPAIPFKTMYPKDSLSYQRDTCSSTSIDALFTINSEGKQSKWPSTDE